MNFVQSRFRRRSLYFYLAVLVCGVLVLFGWQYHISILVTVMPGFNSMKANTAVCFMVLALAGIASLKLRGSARQWVVSIATLLVIVLNVLTLLEYCLPVNFGIDEFLFSDPDSNLTRWPPGRLAPVTAINFILLSLTLLLERFRTLYQSLIVIVCILSFQALVGYAAGVKYLFGSSYYTQLALHTAVLFGVLSGGLLLMHSDRGFMPILLSRGIAGKVGRTLLAAAIIFPPVVNALEIYGMGRGWWNQDFGVLIRVVANVLFFSGIAYRTSSELLISDTGKHSAQSRLNLIADTMPTLVSYVNTREEYEFVNAAYQRFTGIRRDQILGMKIEQLQAASYVESKPYIHQALQGQTVSFINQVLDSQGQPRMFSITYVPEKDEGGAVKGFVVVGHEVTEQVRTEKKLKDALIARDDLLASCSHELKTPITTMKLANQLLLRDFKKTGELAVSPESCYHATKQYERQLTRLNRVVDEMINFATVRDSELEVNRSQFELQGWLEEKVAEQREAIEAAACEVAIEPLDQALNQPVDQALVNWDQMRMEQAFNHLLSNAIKYAAGKKIVIRVFHDQDVAGFSVEDRGSGIRAEDLERIFSPYERAVSVNNISGLGLGLYVVKEIVKAHDGTIVVESTLGSGSKFTISAPSYL